MIAAPRLSASGSNLSTGMSIPPTFTTVLCSITLLLLFALFHVARGLPRPRTTRSTHESGLGLRRREHRGDDVRFEAAAVVRAVAKWFVRALAAATERDD